MGSVKYRVKNWSKHNKAFKSRSSVTFWREEKATAQWQHDPPNGEDKVPRPAGPVTHVVFDATGLKVLVKANGKSTNTPRKSAVPGVNVESEQVVCEEISLVNVGDNEVLQPC